jgi:hypothetical protein
MPIQELVVLVVAAVDMTFMQLEQQDQRTLAAVVAVQHSTLVEQVVDLEL